MSVDQALQSITVVERLKKKTLKNVDLYVLHD
jgi:hypothetical protein